MMMLTAAVLLSSHSVDAQDGQRDRAAAQALFDEAVELRDQGATQQACAKFEESLRLDPGVGTRFNLADCFERVGKLASGWTHFLEVAAATEMAGQPERAAMARDRAKKLEPRLAKLRIEPVDPAPGLVIRRGGADVGRAQWGTAIPIDPGRYTIEASAAGRRSWSKQVVIAKEGAQVTVTVPALAAAPTDGSGEPGAGSHLPVTGSSGAEDGDGGAVRGTIGLVMGGLGLAGIGVGSAFGLIAMSKKNEVDELCPDETKCTAAGIAINDEAKTAGTVSTIGFVAGGALLVGGLVLWLTAPSGDGEGQKSAAPYLQVLPTVAQSGPAVLLQGAW
ncbi:MAG: hypothetical protein DRI90_06165 [Deltaproteobacteria bacterium]|nr:MAG: hypothetical protein DRI90_06165 [Deltaproteobacteria bacterium]